MELLKRYPVWISRFGILYGTRVLRNNPDWHNCFILHSKEIVDGHEVFKELDFMRDSFKINAFKQLKTLSILVTDYLKGFRRDNQLMKELGFQTVGYGIWSGNEMVLEKTCEMEFPMVRVLFNGNKEAFPTNDLAQALKWFVSKRLDSFATLPSQLRDMVVL